MLFGTQRDFEAEVAIPQLIDKGKQFWCGEHERPLIKAMELYFICTLMH